MILDLHWTAWLLIAVATLPGTALAIAFYLAHTRGDAAREKGDTQ